MRYVTGVIFCEHAKQHTSELQLSVHNGNTKHMRNIVIYIKNLQVIDVILFLDFILYIIHAIRKWHTSFKTPQKRL